jgi:hypothetical protein
MNTELDVLRDVAEKLETAGIAYMLTGSMAMNFYAEPRMTRDMDIVLSLKQTDASTLVTLFEETYYVSEEEIIDALKYVSMFNIIYQALVIKVDFIVKKPNEYDQVAFERRRQIQANGFMVWTISKEDLILAKLLWFKASDSAQQQRDVRNLLNTEYDNVYLRLWATRLHIDDLLTEMNL